MVSREIGISIWMIDSQDLHNCIQELTIEWFACSPCIDSLLCTWSEKKINIFSFCSSQSSIFNLYLHRVHARWTRKYFSGWCYIAWANEGWTEDDTWITDFTNVIISWISSFFNNSFQIRKNVCYILGEDILLFNLFWTVGPYLEKKSNNSSKPVSLRKTLIITMK